MGEQPALDEVVLRRRAIPRPAKDEMSEAELECDRSPRVTNISRPESGVYTALGIALAFMTLIIYAACREPVTTAAKIAAGQIALGGASFAVSRLRPLRSVSQTASPRRARACRYRSCARGSYRPYPPRDKRRSIAPRSSGEPSCRAAARAGPPQPCRGALVFRSRCAHCPYTRWRASSSSVGGLWQGLERATPL